MKCELISWEQYANLAHALSEQIRASGIAVDLIVAIGRGGYMPARLLSDFLGIMNLTTFKIEHYHGSLKSPQAVVKYPLIADVNQQTILLVDDVSDSGDTFSVAIDHIQLQGRPKSIHTAVLHHKTVSEFEPDFFAQIVRKWRWIIYPWAVTEDLAVLISSLDHRSANATTLLEQLIEVHGIEPTLQQIKDALSLINN